VSNRSGVRIPAGSFFLEKQQKGIKLKKAIIIGSIIVGIMGFIYILNSFSAKEVFEPFKNASLFSVLGFIFISFLMSVVLTKKWHVINKSIDIKIPFWELYLYRLSGYCISYLTPGPRVGGEPVIASLLKKRGINYMKSLSAMVIDKTLDASASGVVFIIGVFTALSWFALPGNTKSLMIVVAVLFAAIIGYFYYRMLKGKNFLGKIIQITKMNKISFLKKYEKKITDFEELIIKFHKTKKKAFLKATSLAFLSVILMFFEYFFVLRILGESTSVVGLFLIVAFVGAALLFPIPAAIGSLEAGQISAAAINGLKSSIGFGISIIIRARDLVWVFMGFMLLFYFGFDIKRFFKKSLRKYVRINKNVKVYFKE